MPPHVTSGTPQNPQHITSTLEAFLTDHPNSLLLEDGRTLFDLRHASYALSTTSGRATLHLWSEDRNLVRRILAVTPRSNTLRLTTQRLGQPRAQTLELTPDKSPRTPSTRDSNRQRYLHLLDRALRRTFPDHRPEAFRSATDLERSFGPAFARGLLIRGPQAWAVIAINAAEPQTSIDGILTFGILWLQHCRDHAAPTSSRPGHLIQGLRLILPRGTAATTLSRLAWLNPRVSTYELFELDDGTEVLLPRDPADHGNLATRLIHAPNPAAAHTRFAEAIPGILALLPPNTPTFGLDHPAGTQSQPHPSPPPPTDPSQRRVPHPSQPHRDGWVSATFHSGTTTPPSAHRNTHPSPVTQPCELRLRSNTELAFLLHGLEFARIRSSFAGQSFNRHLEVTVGAAPNEVTLTPDTEPHLRELVHHLFTRRHPNPQTANPTQDPLFRTRPERWLESTLRADLPALDPDLQPAPAYTEVPAFTGAGPNLDRGMLDLLAVTRSNRLAVIELKADEDLHLALQGLDYWIRVRHHHLANIDPSTGLGDLQQHGYFPQTRLSSEPPHLFLAAPALHIHPATETILRHLSPDVPWTLIALDERWRTHIKPVWRKRSSDAISTNLVRS